MKHLIFYDGSCGFCNASVSFVYVRDPQGQFAFAPLQGETAQKYKITGPPKSLILIENVSSSPHTLREGKASLRIAWYLGGLWSIIGILSFAPGFLFNWVYRLVARHRPSLSCAVPEDSSRFLP